MSSGASAGAIGRYRILVAADFDRSGLWRGDLRYCIHRIICTYARHHCAHMPTHFVAQAAPNALSLNVVGAHVSRTLGVLLTPPASLAAPRKQLCVHLIGLPQMLPPKPRSRTFPSPNRRPLGHCIWSKYSHSNASETGTLISSFPAHRPSLNESSIRIVSDVAGCVWRAAAICQWTSLAVRRYPALERGCKRPQRHWYCMPSGRAVRTRLPLLGG